MNWSGRTQSCAQWMRLYSDRISVKIAIFELLIENDVTLLFSLFSGEY
jgi:hypothetical protein